jgi:D-lactate dehydrogenase
LPGFAPHAIAVHALALLLALNRKIPQTLGRVSQGDFTTDGLMGFNLHEKTIGIIGLGRIGSTFARIMLGFGCRIIAFDPLKRTDSTIEDIMFLSLKELFKQSDIISLHCDQNELSSGIVSWKALKTVKPNLILINTARGKLVDTAAVLDALKEHKISGYGADVYENDEAVFLHKFGSIEKIKDPLLMSLIQQPGVIITPHIGYLTFDAMQQAARTIINELTYYESRCTNEPFDQLMI